MGENNEQLMQFISWLQQTKFPEASVEQVAQQVQAMSQDPQGQQELQSLVQEFQQSTGMFKKGGKIDQLVEKRKKIKKAKEGTTVPDNKNQKSPSKKPQVSREEDNPYKDHKYVQQEYWGPNNDRVQVITATERNLLPANQAKDPNSDWNVGMGEYDGNHLILNADKNGIKSIYHGFGSQSGADPRLHGADSVAALNQIISRMKVAGIPIGFPLVKNPEGYNPNIW